MNQLMLVIGIVLLLASCQSKPVLESGVNSENGILIAEVTSTGIKGLEHAIPVIDGIQFTGDLKNGYIKISLPAGEHFFNYFIPDLSITSSSVDIDEEHDNQNFNYPVNRKFRIEKGKVTNIGKLFYYDTDLNSYEQLIKKNMSSRGFYHKIDEVYYILAYLDNSASIKNYITEKYEELYRLLKNGDIHLERGNYLSLDDLRAVQNNAANNALRIKLKRYEKLGAYVGGKAGSIGIVSFNQGKPKIDSVVNTNKVMNFSHCNGDRSKLICMLNQREYIIVDKNIINKYSVPSDIKMNSAFISDTEIVLVDDYFNVYTKVHNNDKWQKNTKFKTIFPVEKNNTVISGINDFKFSTTKNGFFIFAYNQSSAKFPVLFNDSTTNRLSLVRFPEKIENIIAVKDTERGLYTAISRQSIANSELYYKSSFSESWQKRFIPASACLDIVFLDTNGNNIEALCETNKIGFISYNGGETWIERQ